MTNQVPTAPLTTLTVGAHCNFHTQVANLGTAMDPEALHIADVFTRYSQAVEVEASIVNRQTTFIATEEMKQADKMRDDMISVIKAVINAHQYTHIEAKKTAYNVLYAVFAPYRDIRTHEFSRQTAEVEEFQKTENAAHVTTLALTQEVEKLAEANAIFSIEMQKKSMEMAARMPEKDIDTATARAECDRLYTEMVAIVNAYALIQPSETINNFVAQLTGIVETFRLIAANTGKSQKKEDAGTTPETPAEPTAPTE